MDNSDKYPDSYRENWSGIAGLFFLPLFLLVLGVALARSIHPISNSVTAYLPAIGVGGGPPQLKPQAITNSNFTVTDATLRHNKIIGFINKDVYDSGARVYLNLAAQYQQNCGSKTEQQNVVISKNADNYETAAQGYTWTINLLLSEPTDLCPSDSAQGDNINRDLMGKVYLSNDEGKSVFLDQDSGKPYEMFLDL